MQMLIEKVNALKLTTIAEKEQGAILALFLFEKIGKKCIDNISPHRGFML